MKGLYYQVKLNYKGTNIGINGLTYRIRYQSLVFPTTGGLLLKNKITKDGLTEKFYVKQNEFIVVVEIKGGKTQYQEYTNLIKNKLEGIKVNTEAVKKGVLNDSVPYIIEVELPINPPFSAVAQEASSRIKNEKNKVERHQVRKGEKLSEIAKYYDRDIGLILKNNNIDNADNIKEGQVLYVGANILNKEVKVINKAVLRKYIVKSGDSLYSISKKFNISVGKLAILNNISLSDLNIVKVGDEIIVDWMDNGNSVIDALIDNGKNIELASYDKSLPVNKAIRSTSAKVYALSTSKNFLNNIAGTLDLGFAVDNNGDWLLYYSLGAKAQVDARDIKPNLHSSDLDKDDLDKLMKEKGKIDLRLSMGYARQQVKLKNGISDLTGWGRSKSANINVLQFEGAHTDVWAVDNEGQVIVEGEALEIGVSGGSKKVKDYVKKGELASGGTSIGKSYTVPLLMNNSNEVFFSDKAIIIDDLK